MARWAGELVGRENASAGGVIFLDSHVMRRYRAQYESGQPSARPPELRRSAEPSGIAAARWAGLSQSNLPKIETGAPHASYTDDEALCRTYGTAWIKHRASDLIPLRTVPKRRSAPARLEGFPSRGAAGHGAAAGLRSHRKDSAGGN